MSKKDDKMITCGTALKKAFNELNMFQLESQKPELITFVEDLFNKNNVPREYANEVITQLKTKTLKKGVIYLGDIVLKCMGLGVPPKKNRRTY